MARYNDDDYKNILARLLRISLVNAEPAKELIEQMFDSKEFQEQARNLCDAYMRPEYRESKLISRTIDIRAVPALVRICKREKLGIIPLDFNGEEGRTYEIGDKINILFLSLQEAEFEKAALEACAVSGVADEIIRKYADTFAKKLKDENPMIEIEGVNIKQYDSMKEQMNKLPCTLRFTMFPEQRNDGKLNVGFFMKTEEMTLNTGWKTEKNGPYLIPKIASVLLACSLLENSEYEKEYEEKTEQNKICTDAILNFYYEADGPFYMVPASIGKSSSMNVFMDQSVYFDVDSSACPGYEEFETLVEEKTSGLNNTMIPMTMSEYEKFKGEVTIDYRNLSFYKENPVPAYLSPEIVRNEQISEQLIDVLNRKREQVLLMSDDFNGRNLGNLENYITGTVHEIIMREDEDYTDWLEKDELLDGKEMALLADLESAYHLSYVYEDHDRVTELINAERQELEGFRSKADHLETER